MVFNSQTFEPEVTKRDNGATAYAPGDTGYDRISAQQSRPPVQGRAFPPTAAWHPDPQVTTSPRRSPYELGLAASASPQQTARQATHTAPGEDTLTAHVVPAVTKAGDPPDTEDPDEDDDLTAIHRARTRMHRRVHEQAAAGEPMEPPVRPPAHEFERVVTKSTSGSDTPIAPLRHATRPGQGRHPATGRFSEGENVAAGHASLDQQPKPLSGGGGPQNAQRSEPGMNASGRGTFDNIPRPERLPLTVPVSRLDLRSPAGLPGGLVRDPDPQPVSRPSPILDPEACGTSGQAQVPQHPRSAFMNAASGPLAAAISTHMNKPVVLGVPSDQATGRAPGEVS